MRAIALFLFGCLYVFCQQEVIHHVEEMKYPRLAQMGQVSGVVCIEWLKGGSFRTTKGHPILIPSAEENLKKIGGFFGKDVTVVYQFILVDTGTSRSKKVVVKRGDAFDRFFLRVFRMKTEKVIEKPECEDSQNNLKNTIDLSKDPIEIRVFGSIPCLQTLPASTVSRR